MILLLSTCYHRLSEMEFVDPIKRILDELQFEVRHYSQKFDPSKYDMIIICGTSLNDFEYIDEMEYFSWIKNYQGKILGICSGAQIIASVFGDILEDRTMIGKRMVSIEKENNIVSGELEAYFLTTKVPIIKNLVSLDKDGFVFRKKDAEIYGVLFHPEVLNKEIIEKFCK